MDVPKADSLLTQPTRARLFETLQGLRRAASTEELAANLGLHVNGVRRHLELMESNGLLERRRVSRGRGRPRDEWSIASEARPAGTDPEAYSELAGWLARAIPDSPRRLQEIEQAGKSIGREMAPQTDDDLDTALLDAFTTLGFQPQIESAGESVSCRLANCPYRRSAVENPDVVCTLHRGITIGLLESLDSGAVLTRFEPHDPEQAGCLVEVTAGAAGRGSEPKPA